MTKILTTIGPASEGKNLEYFVRHSDLLRFNMSHNLLSWHKRNISKVKKINPKKLILVDVPGVKPRTVNKKPIFIKKGAKVGFSYEKVNRNIIGLSNSLPKIIKKPKYFYLSDGSFEFKFVKNLNKVLYGISCQNFLLYPSKGLNIPYSEYNNNLQEKVYFSFLKKINRLKVDCVGLSFIQDDKILKKIKKKYPKIILVSKIENFLGYKNRENIIKNSDAVMIDRGDLAAEVGLNKLSEYSENIVNDSKIFGKPVIIATENLNSLLIGSAPSKSDIINIDYYIKNNAEYLMLSDETATSKNSKKIIKWLSDYLKSKKKVNGNVKPSPLTIENTINKLNDETLVIFSKKGYIYEKISSTSYQNLVFFTENKKLYKTLKLKNNTHSILTKFPKKYLYNIQYNFIYKNLKKNKNLIFQKNKFAYLVNVIFPRKESRANSISIIKTKDLN